MSGYESDKDNNWLGEFAAILRNHSSSPSTDGLCVIGSSARVASAVCSWILRGSLVARSRPSCRQCRPAADPGPRSCGLICRCWLHCQCPLAFRCRPVRVTARGSVLYTLTTAPGSIAAAKIRLRTGTERHRQWGVIGSTSLKINRLAMSRAHSQAPFPFGKLSMLRCTGLLLACQRTRPQWGGLKSLIMLRRYTMAPDAYPTVPTRCFLNPSYPPLSSPQLILLTSSLHPPYPWPPGHPWEMAAWQMGKPPPVRPWCMSDGSWLTGRARITHQPPPFKSRTDDYFISHLFITYLQKQRRELGGLRRTLLRREGYRIGGVE